MSRFAPLLVLLGGAVGLYFLWSKIFGGPPPKTKDETDADFVTKFRSECEAKGGTLQQVSTGEAIKNAGSVASGYSCRLPDLAPDKVVPGAYGSCPDRLSCQGMPSPQPPNVPSPPANNPTGTSSLPYRYLGGGGSYRTLGQ